MEHSAPGFTAQEATAHVFICDADLSGVGVAIGKALRGAAAGAIKAIGADKVRVLGEHVIPQLRMQQEIE
eukprot:scaffold217565_cov17-Tisochrysis_lutea.AAC.2